MTQQSQLSQQVRQSKAEWAQADPVTLVHEARTAIYTTLQNQNDPQVQAIIGPLSEVVDRFDQLARASMGSQITSTGGSSSGSSGS